LSILSVGTSYAYSFEKTLSSEEARSIVPELEKEAYVDLDKAFRFPAEDDLLVFLFENLDLAGSVARAWNITDLEVVQRSPRSYSARIRTDMEGATYRLELREGYARYSGFGVYRSSFLPISVQGKALMTVSWNNSVDQDTFQIDTNLKLRPSSRVIEVIGWALYPLVKSRLQWAHGKVIDLGKTLGHKLRNNPRKTVEKLESIDAEHAERWEKFLEQHPGFGAGDSGSI
jgi:hypothetical protein